MKSVHFGHRGVALHAMSAIDIALYDLAGKILGQPVHKLLGGAFRDRVPVYASALMPWTLDGVRELVSSYREQGYRRRQARLGADRRRRPAGRRRSSAPRARHADPIVDLMIDAGRVWTWKQALQMSRRFEEFELSWLEEPLPVDDLDGYARLCEHSALRIASAENETTIFAFREWIERAGLDIVQPDLARCGGFTQGRRIAALTWERNRAMVPHAFSTGILVAASLHMTAAMPHGTLTEFSVADGPLVRDLLLDPFALESDGTVLVPTGPGLGIELEPERRRALPRGAMSFGADAGHLRTYGDSCRSAASLRPHAPATRPPTGDWSSRTAPSCTPTATACWARSTMPRTRCRTRSFARGADSRGSRVEARRATGSTGSRRTRAWTSRRAGRSACCRSTPFRRCAGRGSRSTARRVGVDRGVSRSGARRARGSAAPEARYELRESLELAFVAALQHLPARQTRGADPARGARASPLRRPPPCSSSRFRR